MNSKIMKVATIYSTMTGRLKGEDVKETVRKLGDIAGIFEDQNAVKTMDMDMLAYRVESHHPVDEGKSGGLFFGTSYLQAGKVGSEYFMTKGHFHSNRDTAEYYWCISGQGCLLLMDEEGEVTAESMEEGSLHYIPGNIAHRIANTGDSELVVGACWPSDAGHDYGTIAESGFSYRLFDVDGVPTLRKG